MRYVLLPLTLPMFLGYLVIAFFTLLNGTRKHRFDKTMWTWECQWNTWVIYPRTWLTWNPFGQLFVWEDNVSWPKDSKFATLNAAGGRWNFAYGPTEEGRKYARNIWKYSTTFAYGIVFHPWSIDEDETVEADTRLERHEDVHVRQNQDMLVLSFVVGLVVAIGFWAHGHGASGAWWWLGLWVSGLFWLAPNFLTAFLRGGNFYRDSEHERSAYAQTDIWPNGSSWLEEHLEDPREL